MTAAPVPTARTELRTLPDALAHWARVQPDAPALAHGGEQLAYRELAAMVEDLAGRLGRAGLVRGERVALAGSNSVEWVVCFLAGLRLGAVVVPLNRRLSPLELGRQIDLCRPRLVAAGEAERATLEQAGTTGSHPTLALERDAGTESIWRLTPGEMDAQAPGSAPALISFTSGTTGAPKGAVITHDALVRSAASFVPYLETSEADSTLVAVPLFHNTGFADQLTQMLVVGGAVELLGEFGTTAALDALTERPASYLIAVPSIFRLLMLHERADDAFRHCRVAVYGGAPMPTAWIEELAYRWPSLRLFNCYGLTEFTSVSHLLTPEFARSHADSVGRPVHGVRQRIVDEHGRPLPSTEIGEIELVGPTRMQGYWEAEAATQDVFRGEWLRTGDVGEIDGDGFLMLRGRAADVINRGGEKVHAAQVEDALSRLPGVAEAAVVGAPHPIFQESVVACVVLRAGHELDEEAARAHLAERVPDYAIPERFEVVDELPRNAAGKLDRPRIQAAVAGSAVEP
jgi:acyl-CoA synthetase (AMP-forming)/AMP-acid ligase II